MKFVGSIIDVGTKHRRLPTADSPPILSTHQYRGGVRRGLNDDMVKPKTMQLKFAVYPLNRQYYGLRAKTNMLRVSCDSVALNGILFYHL